MSDEERVQQELLIAAIQRRLRVLQLKAARYGYETPPSIITEQREATSDLLHAQRMLAQLKAGHDERSD